MKVIPNNRLTVAKRNRQRDELMSKHIIISPKEAADRLAIRELVEAYAHCADRRDAKGQMALFTADTHFVVYMNAKDPKPSQELHSREALAPVFADLNKYDATMHFVGQSTILMLRGLRWQSRVEGVGGLA
jgi:SnoaL-like domain